MNNNFDFNYAVLFLQNLKNNNLITSEEYEKTVLGIEKEIT